MSIELIGQMYKGLGPLHRSSTRPLCGLDAARARHHLYEVVGSAGWHCQVQAIDDPGVLVWVSLSELAGMERVVPDVLAELEAAWQAPVARVAPILSRASGLTDTSAQEDHRG